MALSFRTIRNLGLVLLVGVVLLLGVNSLVTSSRTIASLTQVLKETRPILSKIAILRTNVEAAQFYLLNYIARRDTDTVAIIAHVDTATEAARELEGLVDESDRAEVKRFLVSLTRFREAVAKICNGSPGVSPEGIAAATRERALSESMRLLSSIKRLSSKLRDRIEVSMTRLVEENTRAQGASVLFISSGLIFSLLVAFFMNRALVRPARRIMDGLERMGGGDLDHDIEIRSKDVFRDLARAVNEMARKRREAEDALRESERKYRELVQNANSIVLKMDIDGKLTFFNEFAQQFFGYAEEEILGRNIVGTIVPDSESSGRDLREFFSKFRTDPDRYINNENENITRDGRRVWISWTNKAIRDDSGGVIGILSVGNDITQRRRLEEQLIQSQKMEAVGCLAGGVAHDFNNLLTAIAGYSDLLLSTLSDKDSLRRDIEEIKKAAARATSLTRQLMAFSRRQTIQPRVLDLNVVIGEMRRMLQRVVGEGITLDTELAPDLSPVNVDRAKFEQVIMNFVVNARDAMNGGGRVTIETKNVTLGKDYGMVVPEARPGTFVCVSVTDTGKGMGKEVLERIFDPFFSTKGPARGAGLGLAIVYGIVKQHGGWVRAYSEPGKGSVLRVYLPVCSLDAASRTGKDAPEALSCGLGESVLVVEDEEGVRRFVEKSLNENGYVAMTASSGAEAREIFDEGGGGFDLLYCDISLPDEDGIDLAGELSARNRDLRVLLTSGYNDRVERLPLINEKGFHYLQKPVSRPALLHAVREALGPTS